MNKKKKISMIFLIYFNLFKNRNDENYDEMNDDLEMMMMEELKML